MTPFETSPLRCGRAAASDSLTLADFQFEVPASQVAQTPLEHRDAARLLCHHRGGSVSHHQVSDLVALLPAGAVVVVNNTQVFASRLLGQLPTGGKVELFLLDRPEGDPQARAHALGRPLRKLKPGLCLDLGEGLRATIAEPAPSAAGGSAPLELIFNRSHQEVLAWLARWAYVPLPPYIQRQQPLPVSSSPDRERYQTVYADPVGSVAAPTAGLHFTPQLLASFQGKGIQLAEVTLHVGAGTFLPVKSQQLSGHPMHEEAFLVGASSLATILAAKKEGRPVVVVGTTSLRSLEALYTLAEGDSQGMASLADRWHKTRLFIYPKNRSDRYTPWAADALMTNFHQPQSTLFMLVCALLGYEEAFKLYHQAVANGYRFYSYGDASLLAFRDGLFT